MHSQDFDAGIYALALAREVPEAAHIPAIRDAVAAATDAAAGAGAVSTSSENSLQQVLDAAALLLLCPEQTVRVARAVGPLLLDVLARALSAARIDSKTRATTTVEQHKLRISSVVAGATAVERAENVLVSMSRLLPSAPHALPLALQYWRSSPCPFDCLRQACCPRTLKTATTSSQGERKGGATAADGLLPTRFSTSTVVGGEEDVESSLKKRIHLVTESAHKLLLCAQVSSSLRELWNWSPFFALCRYEDVLVRWRAVGVCASLLGVDEHGRRELLEATSVPDSSNTKFVTSPLASSTSNAAPASLHGVRNTGGGGAVASTVGSDQSNTTNNSNNEESIILNAALDLSEELRRAPSLLCSSRRKKTKKSGVKQNPDDDQEQHQHSAAEGRMALTSNSAEGDVAAAVVRPSIASFRHHPAVADIGGILHAKTTNPTANVPSGKSTSTAVVSNAFFPNTSDGRLGQQQKTQFVRTASASRNMSALSLAMAVNRPVLLHGPAGSGKSLLAREAARLAAATNPEGGTELSSHLLELHLDDQTDSKSLLGAHACTDIPGEFAWRPGALTRAAVAGTWVLIEDLDRAPFEVLAALGPLLEGRPLVLPGRKKPLRAAPGFRVFGTVTTTGPGRVVIGGAADFGALWIHVSLNIWSI